jgi:hypothetical protein
MAGPVKSLSDFLRSRAQNLQGNESDEELIEPYGVRVMPLVAQFACNGSNKKLIIRA